MKYFLFILIQIVAVDFVIGQSSINSQFFEQADQFLARHVIDGNVNYATAKTDETLKNLIKQIATTNLKDEDAATKQAFLINAYNLHVINAVAKKYPLQSVMETNGFFDQMKITVAGETTTLNQLEKEKLLKAYKDPRYHFVLVCAAVSCPPITNFAYTPKKLEEQLEQQTVKAINNPNFIKLKEDKLLVSKIFEWYMDDFGGNKKSIIKFINQYKKVPVEEDTKINFETYDWALNAHKATASKIEKPVVSKKKKKKKDADFDRYILSAALPKGTFEVRLFNNIYAENFEVNPALFIPSIYTSHTLTALYGISNVFNAGFTTRYRFVKLNPNRDNPFSVFTFKDTLNVRNQLTNFGPIVRYAPFQMLPNFSVQGSFLFPVGKNLTTLPFIDWNGPTLNIQLFNDVPIGTDFSLFTELDFLLEDIGKLDKGHSNRFSTPATLIFSYYPIPIITVYGLFGYSPYYQETFDYFWQSGLGAKYQYSPLIELELLYNYFTKKSFVQYDGKAFASTYNLGLRFSF